MTRRDVLFAAPLGAAALGGSAFAAMLLGLRRGWFDPHGIGTPLLDRPVPEFSLPAQSPGEGFSGADLRAAGRPVLVNFFASWCRPCIVEHPLLLDLARTGLPIWGVAYEDKPDLASGFLQRNGNPYARIGADSDGRTAIDWGVSGVPESFLVDGAGRVRWHQPAGLDPAVVTSQLLPALKAVS